MAEKDRSGCCNPVRKPGPVSMDHVLAALRESKEERDSRIKSLFNFFDSANVGYLDYSQIEKGLSALQIPAEYKYAKELLWVCDKNRDGRVDYQEFRKYMDDKELEIYKIFQAIDVEHNGCILPEELWDALVKAGIFTLLSFFPKSWAIDKFHFSNCYKLLWFHKYFIVLSWVIDYFSLWIMRC